MCIPRVGYVAAFGGTLAVFTLLLSACQSQQPTAQTVQGGTVQAAPAATATPAAATTGAQVPAATATTTAATATPAVRRPLTALVALPLRNDAVEVSDLNTPGEGKESLVDGNPETIWHVKYPPQTSEHWVLIDLGVPWAVDAVRVIPRRGQAGQMWDGDNAVLQGSDDKASWTPLGPLSVDKKTLNNDNPDWLTFAVKGDKPFRYYRMLIRDPGFLSFAELKLLRRPDSPLTGGAQTTPQGLAQLALKPDAIEVSDFNTPGEGKESLVDGSPETIWHVKYPPQTSEHWVLIDLGVASTVDAVRVMPRQGQVLQMWGGDNAVFQGSDDEATWTPLGPLSVSKDSLNNDNPAWLTFPVRGDKPFRYYRVLIRDAGFLSFAELQLLSRQATSQAPAKQ